MGLMLMGEALFRENVGNFSKKRRRAKEPYRIMLLLHSNVIDLIRFFFFVFQWGKGGMADSYRNQNPQMGVHLSASQSDTYTTVESGP